MATNYLTSESGEIVSDGNPFARLSNESGEIVSDGNPFARLSNESGEIVSDGLPGVRLTNLSIELLGNVNPPTPSITNLTLQNVQTRTFLLQVWRNGNWVTIPIRSVNGRIDKAKAGQMTCVLDDKPDDTYRSQLFEGEKVRAYRGLLGSPIARTWTGFVDAPTANDEGEISRSVIMTDNLQELNTSILLQGYYFDNLDPMYVAASCIQHAIDTKQYIPTDDSGNALTTTASFSSPNGNAICYFPELFDIYGNPYTLASGQLGSATSGPFAYASLMVPIASAGQTYLTYTLPFQYLIPSMTTILNWNIATTTTLPPPASSSVIDYYNGIIYFNPSDQGKTLFASTTYFQSPIWAFAPGTKVFDIISEVMDKSGCRWGVDAYGKFWSKYIDTITTPKRIFNRGSYMTLSIQTNRDRRNVIICEGWDNKLSQLIVAKAINFSDINNPPPIGLGKRQFMIIQDASWRDQNTVNAAAYYAAQQIGKRGKLKSVKIIDDPTLGVEDTVMFEGPIPEAGVGDIFYIDSVEWQYEVGKDGGMTAQETLSGGMFPGQGLVYVGPVNSNSNTGALDYTVDQTPIASCSLSPVGGKYYSTFSIANGLTLNFSEPGFYAASTSGSGSVDLYGSDGSHLGPLHLPASMCVGGGPFHYTLPTASMSAGLLYLVRLVFQDTNKNIGYYRDFINSIQ